MSWNLSDDGIEWAARAGYTAKGIVYATIGGLAVAEASSGSGETASGEEALRQVAAGPMGTFAVALVGLGLAGYVVWRLVQAILDPEGRTSVDETRRWGMRAFYLASAILYAALAYTALDLVFGGASDGGGSGTRIWTSRLMEKPAGRWLVGVVGAGIAARGILQFVKAYTESFRDRIHQFDLGGHGESIAMTTSRIGLSARGVIFLLIGGYVAYAAVRHDPAQARGLEEALELLRGAPWLLGSLGLGLIAYAVYQWVKSRYRMIGA